MPLSYREAHRDLEDPASISRRPANGRLWSLSTSPPNAPVSPEYVRTGRVRESGSDTIFVHECLFPGTLKRHPSPAFGRCWAFSALTYLLLSAPEPFVSSRKSCGLMLCSLRPTGA